MLKLTLLIHSINFFNCFPDRSYTFVVIFLFELLLTGSPNSIYSAATQ